MSWLIIIAKVWLSGLFVGFFLGGVQRASPRGHNPEINPKIEYFVGALGVIIGVVGMVYIWT